MVLPSTLVKLLFRDHRAAFVKHMGANTDKLREFWRQFLARPLTRQWASRHPVLRNKSVADLVTTIPCATHTDAGPVTLTRSSNILSWSSMVGVGGEKVTKYIIASHLKVAESSVVDEPAWGKLLRDFDCLAEGVDGEGEPVAQEGRRKWRFCLLVFKSDEDVKANELGMCHFNAPEPCQDCWANDSNRPCTDLTHGAAWRATAHAGFEAPL